MNDLGFGSNEAEELRAQLLKERRKRIDAEERCRALEQQLRLLKSNVNLPEIVVSSATSTKSVRIRR
jgi:hypothetical protein